MNNPRRDDEALEYSVKEVEPMFTDPPEQERVNKDSLVPATQIRSVLIIDTGGTTLVERNYDIDSESESDLSLFGGFVAAIAQLCEDVAQDEVRAIQLGSAQFIVLRTNGLLFTLHVGFEVSRFTTMAKLKRIRDTLLEKYGEELPTHLATPHPSLLEEIDSIVFEQTAVDLEQILDYFLTGENILGAELRDARTDNILFTHAPSDNVKLTECNSILFQVFFEMLAAQGGLSTNSDASRNCLLFKLGGNWLCGIREQNILLVSIFDKHVDQRVILDIVYGKLGQMLTFVAQYFQEIS